MGPERHQDLDHQRRPGQHARHRGSRSTPTSELAARPASWSPREPPGSARDRSSRRWASGPRTPPRSCWTTAGCPGRCLLGGKEPSRRAAWPGPRRASGRRPRRRWRTFEASRPMVGAQAVGIARAAYEYALDYAKERQAVRTGHRREPGHRLQARRHEDADRRRPAARVAGRVDGPERQAVRGGRGLPVEALRRRDRGVGHRAGDPDPGRLRLHPRAPGRALAPRLEDLHHLRGDQRRSNAWSSAGPSRGCTSSRRVFAPARDPGGAVRSRRESAS